MTQSSRREVDTLSMSTDKTRTDESSSLKTKLSLTRISRWHGLSDESVASVRAELMTSLGLVDGSLLDGSRPESGVSSPTAAAVALPASSEDSGEAQLNAQIRHLVGAGAPWHVIFSVLWGNYEKAPTLIKAARILETAFVEASPSETIQIFSRLMTSGQKGFYFYLHPSLRDFIIEHAPQQYLDQLYWNIAKERDDARLSGIEMTYIFLRVATSSDKTAAWMYFRRHQDRILSSFSRQRHFGMTREQLVFRAGELALGLGYSADAKDLFLKLPQGSDERETALQLILRFESASVDRNKNSYFVQIESAPSWEERLTLIKGFCETTRKLGGDKDPNRSALDLILKSLLKWVPKNPEAWRASGDLIIKYRDIIELVPSLFQPLIEQSIVFHGPDIDGAIWSAAHAMDARTPKERMLQATAALHKYVTNPRLGEEILWTSFTTIKSLESSQINLAWSWRDLIKSARQWIIDSTLLAERDRKRAAAALRLASEGAFATKETVDAYLNHCSGIPESLLVEIAKNALASKNCDFALTMLARTGLKRAFTNRQLTQMWNLAVQSEHPDTAWRIATLLMARDVLPESIKTAWDISGENRSIYQPLSLTEQDVEIASTELSTNTKKLIQALVKLGTKINELITISDPNNHRRPHLSGASAPERSIIDTLKASDVLNHAPRTLVDLMGVHLLPDQAAPFVQAIITSPWLFAFRTISERLSITSWGWNLDALEQTARTVLPLIGRNPSGKISAKTTKWLSSLNSGERSAWNDLVICSQEANHEILTSELVKFVCRLSTILYPNHLQSLKTIHQLRPPLEILRDLEWFIVSDALTTARKRHGVLARIAIPETLKKIKLN